MRLILFVFIHGNKDYYYYYYKFGEKGPIKILAHFCLQVEFHQNFKSFQHTT